MYTKLKIKSRIRIPPALFGKDINDAIEESVRDEFEGQIDSEQGLLLSFIDVEKIGNGIIIPGDGAIYYDTEFNMLAYKPIPQELVEGVITEITETGAFAKIGPIEGLIHKSQVMDDFVSYAKTGVLSGKDTKRTLKVGDKIKARIIATSMNNLQTAKIGLTMRQEGLGSESWLKKEVKKNG